VAARAVELDGGGEIEMRGAIDHAGGEAADVERRDVEAGRVDRRLEAQRVVNLEEELVGGREIDAEREVEAERRAQGKRHLEGEAERVAVQAERGLVDGDCLLVDGVDVDVDLEAARADLDLDIDRAVAETAAGSRAERLLDLGLD